MHRVRHVVQLEGLLRKKRAGKVEKVREGGG